MSTNFVTLACRAHYGAVLTWQGRWPEAERSLSEATDLAERPSWGGLAIVRLADLRRRQGRFAEAEDLLEQRPGNPLAPVVMAELVLDLGDASRAVDLLEPVLRRIPTRNRTLRAAPVELMVRARIATGEAEAATSHLGELRSIAEALGTRPLHAAVALLDGLLAAAGGDRETARERLEDSVELFAASDASFELARARLELARALASLDRNDAAVREAMLALRRLDDIGAVAERRALASCCVTSGRRRRRGGSSARSSSLPRELEILRLVSEGLTDGEIAARLVLSKHTVHRHLQNAYARLGAPRAHPRWRKRTG